MDLSAAPSAARIQHSSRLKQQDRTRKSLSLPSGQSGRGAMPQIHPCPTATGKPGAHGHGKESPEGMGQVTPRSRPLTAHLGPSATHGGRHTRLSLAVCGARGHPTLGTGRK